MDAAAALARSAPALPPPMFIGHGRAGQVDPGNFSTPEDKEGAHP